MKWSAIAVLVALAMSLLLPPSLPLLVAQGAHAELGSLDVCHSAAPALSAGGDMPTVNEAFFAQPHCECITLFRPAEQVFRRFLLSFQDERPPEA